MVQEMEKGPFGKLTCLVLPILLAGTTLPVALSPAPPQPPFGSSCDKHPDKMRNETTVLSLVGPRQL